ncbi:hypothetical protein [Sabulicella glaciei]|uniref:Uncharacterized protein n=1 Tax=Sabulicella glaciei TaxID=2984948 RepID=A0ABT3NSM8_9PROT|nr:hypothetical protein [Roseococcus sp. MDT2-1-1]MCW8085158.1 hypothetical protein [Roseococcus sp. MDT2-1-1]
MASTLIEFPAPGTPRLAQWRRPVAGRRTQAAPRGLPPEVLMFLAFDAAPRGTPAAAGARRPCLAPFPP